MLCVCVCVYWGNTLVMHVTTRAEMSSLGTCQHPIGLRRSGLDERHEPNPAYSEIRVVRKDVGYGAVKYNALSFESSLGSQKKA